MVKAVLFDLDGTLLNRDDSVRLFIQNQYERLNCWLGHIPKEEYVSRFIQLDNRGYVWKDIVYQQLINEYGIGLTWESLLEDYFVGFKNHCVPFPNLINMLEALKEQNLFLGLITNGITRLQLDNVNSLGIKEYFSVLLVSEAEGIKKPSPVIFQKALDALGVLPEESVYVGDHPINDVQAARNAGMLGVWKTDYNWKSPVEADYIINNLSEIPILVKQLSV